MNHIRATRASVVVLQQILNLIPRRLINRHARETGMGTKARGPNTLVVFGEFGLFCLLEVAMMEIPSNLRE
jgi:hypothetical protein